MPSFKDKRIWIIGASSGIGRALAHELHGEGAQLILSARREEELEKVNRELGGGHSIEALDISDFDALKDAAARVTKNERLDSCVLLAAIYEPNPVREMDLDFTRKLIEVNLMGTINVTHALLPILRGQGGGQLALCGSIAGYCGLPNGQPYSASKAAVINFTESLRAEEAKNGIDVRLISPGFVETPMTDKNEFDMPMVIKPEAAARALAKGLGGKSFEIHFPKRFTLILKVLKLLPYPLYFWAAGKLDR